MFASAKLRVTCANFDLINHMFKDLKDAKLSISEDWLAEIKGELAENIKAHSKHYNFDFFENRPGSQTKPGLQWSKCESELLPVSPPPTHSHRRQMILSLNTPKFPVIFKSEPLQA